MVGSKPRDSEGTKAADKRRLDGRVKRLKKPLDGES
jgi:hypothetical protein